MAVNAALCALYIGYKIFINRKSSKGWIYKLGAALPIALLLFSYFILPLVATGSVDKSVVTQDIGSSSETDYTDIIYISNAGDAVTGLALSKNIFIDYANHDGGISESVFIFSQIGILILLVALVSNTFSRQGYRDKCLTIGLLSAAMLFLALSSGNILVSDFLAKIAQLPGGWIFRSPLKWQLYIPWFMIAAFAIQLRYIQPGLRNYALIAVSMLAITGSIYQLNDIRVKLLIPRETGAFSSLPSQVAANSRLLYISGQNCVGFARDNPVIIGELNQHFMALPIQVKRVSQPDLGQVRLRDFNYILTCGENKDQQPIPGDLTKELDSYVDGTFKLYQTESPVSMFTSLDGIDRISLNEDVNALDNAKQSLLEKPFHFAAVQPKALLDTGSFTQLFTGLQRSNISEKTIEVRRDIQRGGGLVSKTDIYYKIAGDEVVEIRGEPLPGFTLLRAGDISEDLPSGENLSFIYDTSSLPIQNKLEAVDVEASFVDKDVSDCFAYDSNSKLSMQVQDSTSNPVDKIVELGAQNHIACTSTSYVSLSGSKSLLVSLDFETSKKNTAGYSVQFNDPNNTTITERIRSQEDVWSSHSKVHDIPEGATSARLFLYGYPGNDDSEMANARYNNIFLSNIPDAISATFVTTSNDTGIKKFKTNYEAVSPTHYRVTIMGASDKGLLKMSETYNNGWQLVWKKDILTSLPAEHISVNNQDNAWLIDFEKLCSTVECVRNPDNTYNLTLNVYYRPQLMFIIGSSLGIVTFAATTLFIVKRRL